MIADMAALLATAALVRKIGAEEGTAKTPRSQSVSVT